MADYFWDLTISFDLAALEKQKSSQSDHMKTVKF